MLEYGLVTKRLVDEAKKPGFSVESWAPLAELVATDEFERVGAVQGGDGLVRLRRLPDQLGDVLGVGMLVAARHRDTRRRCSSSSRSAAALANSATWSTRCRSTSSPTTGKIRHIDLYLQMELPTRRDAEKL